MSSKSVKEPRSKRFGLWSEHIIGNGPAFFRAACRERLEGIVSKRRTGTYQTGRRTWLKTKCIYRKDFAVIGYTNASRARSGLGR